MTSNSRFSTLCGRAAVFFACLSAVFSFSANGKSDFEERATAMHIRLVKQSCAGALQRNYSARAGIFDKMLLTNARLPQSSTIGTLAMLSYFLKHPIALSEMILPVTDAEALEAGQRMTLAHLAKGIPLAMEGIPAPPHFRLLSVATVTRTVQGFFDRLPSAVLDFLSAIDPDGPLKKYRIISAKERSQRLDEISAAVLEYLNRPENKAENSIIQRTIKRFDEVLNSREMADLNLSWQATLKWYEESQAGEVSPPPPIVTRPMYVFQVQSILEIYLRNEPDFSQARIAQVFLSFR